MKLCLFCGSRFSNHPSYRELAVKAADAIADRGCRLMYGGGTLGLMGLVSTRLRARGAYTIGVVPKIFAVPEDSQTVSELVLVDDIAERKKYMCGNADAFLVLPGGIGTYDEIFHILIHNQFEEKKKHIAVINCEGCFDPLESMIETSVAYEFISREEVSFLHVVHSVEEAFSYFEQKGK